METTFTTYWIPIITSTIAGLIVYFVGKLFSEKRPTLKNAINLSQITYVNQKIIIVQNNTTTEKSRDSDDGSNVAFLYVSILLLATILFIKYFYWIILGYQCMLGFTTTILILGFIEFFKAKVIEGGKWMSFLLFALLFLISSILILSLIDDPNLMISQVAGKEISWTLSEVGNNLRLIGLKKILFISFQMLSVVILLLAQWYLLLSLLFFYGSVKRILVPNNFNDWVVKVTRKGSRPLHTIIFSFIMLVLSYFLSSGLFYGWFSIV